MHNSIILIKTCRRTTYINNTIKSINKYTNIKLSFPSFFILLNYNLFKLHNIIFNNMKHTYYNSLP